MFITVRFGDNQELLFNPNCRNDILLYNIKTRCQCENEDVVDLSDETGLVKHLQRNLSGYGTELFREREVTILLKAEKKPNSTEEEQFTYIPLLDGLENDREFIGKLNPTPLPRGRRSSDYTDGRSRTQRRTSVAGSRRQSMPARRSSSRGSLSGLKK